MNKVEIIKGYNDHNEFLKSWIDNELGYNTTNDKPNEYRTLAFLLDGKIIAAMIYYGYRGFEVELAFATTDKRWCSRRAIREIFKLGFEELGVVRMSMTCSKGNRAVRKLVEGTGFTFEGKRKKGFDGVHDLMSYGILKEDCKWLIEPRITENKKDG